LVASGRSEAASNTCCNTSYNSYKPSTLKRDGFSVEDRVYNTVDQSEVELRPAEIARKIHAPAKPTAGQYTSVRVICARLLQRGLIIQPYPGAYCSKITYGVRFVPLMLHNIRLHSNLCVDVKSEVVSEVVGGVGIKVVFGSERRKGVGGD
jgi:hypothetical protein